MNSKNNKQIIVELRAWVEHPSQIRGKIRELGAKLDHTRTFTDHYYGEKDSALDCLWEKSGNSVRIREYGPKDCEIVRKDAVLSTKEGFEAGASKAQVLFKGSLKGSKKFLQNTGYDKHLLDITKTRETYTLNSMGICLDEFAQFGSAMEVILRVDNVEDVPEAEEELVEFLKTLEVKERNIERANVTNKILISQLSKDPEIRKPLLEEELKKYEAKLKECLAKRGDAFVHGGDGWHDNPAFEALNADYDFLKSRIRSIEDELLELRRSS